MKNHQELPEFSGNDRFSIVRRIGEGGMGVVYEAFDRERGMRVALKTLQAIEPARLQKFKQEFRNFTDVVHPNIAVLYELLADDQTVFFTMEMVDGVDFLQYVFEGFDGDGRAPVSVSEVTSIHEDLSSSDSDAAADPGGAVKQRKLTVLSTPRQFKRLRHALLSLSEGVHALHEAGRLHRDLKPSNVLVSRDERVVILDFGLGTTAQSVVGQHIREEKISGTISYMSPEQMSIDAEPSRASDWYSVGTILYQSLTGRLPYAGSLGSVVRMKRQSDPPPPSAITYGIPADLDELCMELLQRDPEARPKGPEIIRRLGGKEIRLITRSEEGPLVGREAEMKRLSSALAETRARKSVVAFVHGRSGAGKSFLVDRFLASIAGDPATEVFLGRCFEAETVPYKALDSLIDSLARYLSRFPDMSSIVPRDVQALTRLFPVLRQVEAFDDVSQEMPEIPNRRELRRRAVGALRELLIALSDRKTLVLCIDDLQWGDVDSTQVLLDLLRPPGAPRFLLLGVYRSEYVRTSQPLGMLLEAGAKDGEVERFDIPLESLSHGDARNLALLLLGDRVAQPERRAEAIAQESGGVPYFIHELVRFTLEHPDQDVEVRPTVSLNDVLIGRFAMLPEWSRHLLEVISVVGRPLRRGDVFHASGLPPEARAAFSQLRGSSMIRSTGSGDEHTVEVYHDRIRETLVAELPRDRISGHYSSLAVTLESAGGYDSETVAICFRGSGQPEKAGDYYEAGAAEATEALAFERAANLYRLSLELRPNLSRERRSELLEKRAEALANAGKTAEAAMVYESAIEGATPSHAIELLRLSAYHYCSSGRLRQGRKAMKTLLATQGLSLPRSTGSTIARLLWNRLKLWHRFRQWQRHPELRETVEQNVSAAELRRIDVTWSASAGLSMMDIVLGAAFQAQNLILALHAGEPYRIARAMSWEAAHTSNSGSYTWPRTLELIDAASRLARKVEHPHAAAMVMMAKGIAEFTMGRWRDAVPLLDEAEQIFRNRCTGVTWEIDTTNAFKLWALVYQGRFTEMASRTATLMNEASEHGDLYASTNLESFMVPHERLAADDVEGAREAVDSSQRRWAQEGFHLQNLTGIMSSVLIDLYEGKWMVAFETIDGNWKRIERAQMLRIQVLRVFLRHFRGRSAVAAAGESRSGSGALIATAKRSLERIRSEGAPWARPMAMSLEALIAAHRNERDLAIRLMKQTREDFDDASMWSYSAAAMRLVGRWSEDEETVVEADRRLAKLGVADPEKMARMHLPDVRIG